MFDNARALFLLLFRVCGGFWIVSDFNESGGYALT
jgi:hypothetical protein